MKFNSPEETSVYLKHVADLETSVYMQGKAIETLKQSIRDHTPVKHEIPQPEDDSYTIDKPYIDYTRIDYGKKEYKYVTYFEICVFLTLCLVGLEIYFLLKNIHLTALLVPIFLILGYGDILYGDVYRHARDRVTTARRNQKKHNDEVQQAYDEAVAERKRIYQDAVSSYPYRVKQEEQRYALACKNDQQSRDFLKQLVPLKAETEKILRDLYAMDVIYPKYRNIIAVCSFCEYFETGRVTDLSGPDGAYNLFEIEVRFDKVILKLDSIIDKLDQIQTSQYKLYEELSRANSYLSNISITLRYLYQTTQAIADDVRSTASSLEDIAANTDSITASKRIEAVNSEVIASNTEALKYIALIS